MNAISFFTSSVWSHLWVPVLCLSFPLVPVRGRPRLPCRPPGWAGGGAAPTSGFAPREAWSGHCRRKQPVPRWTRILVANQFLGGGLRAGGGQRDPSSISAAPRLSDGANKLPLCHTPRSSRPFGVSPAQVAERRQSSTGLSQQARGEATTLCLQFPWAGTPLYCHCNAPGAGLLPCQVNSVWMWGTALPGPGL